MADTPADRIRRVAARYDGDDNEAHQLTEQAERALARRLRDSGKQCSLCKQDKPLRDFSAKADSDDGLQAVCRSCAAEAEYRRRTWRADLH